MKELKFRAWLVGDKEYDWRPRIEDGKLCIMDGNEIYGYEDENTYIIEQYTGLKDKNGKEIYEGDIIGGIWEGGYIGYCEKCKQFQYHSCGECMACLGDVHWYEIVEDDGKLEVIGNIHENPGLLGEEEE